MTYQDHDIYLVGMPGSGKSTLGQILANHLNRTFVDLDQYIESVTGLTVPELFAKGGESYFREVEAKYVRSLGAITYRKVIATGGGTPCYLENMTYINERGLSIYLEVPEEILVQRLLAQPGKRPLVTGKSEGELLSFLSKQLIERKPYYRRATLVVSGLDLQLDHLLTALMSL